MQKNLILSISFLAILCGPVNASIKLNKTNEPISIEKTRRLSFTSATSLKVSDEKTDVTTNDILGYLDLSVTDSSISSTSSISNRRLNIVSVDKKRGLFVYNIIDPVELVAYTSDRIGFMRGKDIIFTESMVDGDITYILCSNGKRYSGSAIFYIHSQCSGGDDGTILEGETYECTLLSPSEQLSLVASASAS